MNRIPAEQNQSRHTPRSIPAGMVKIAEYGNPPDAELDAAVLGANGIKSEIFGANAAIVDWFWQGFNNVDLCVGEQDAQRAKEILAEGPNSDLVPADEPAGTPPPLDNHGREMVVAAEFANAGDLRDAQTLLASANIRFVAPRLVKRADASTIPHGRFVIRVAEHDLEKTRALIAEEAEESRDDLRCPRCGSWRVRGVNSFINGIAEAFGIGHKPEESECGACKFRASTNEFMAHT